MKLSRPKLQFSSLLVAQCRRHCHLMMLLRHCCLTHCQQPLVFWPAFPSLPHANTFMCSPYIHRLDQMRLTLQKTLYHMFTLKILTTKELETAGNCFRGPNSKYYSFSLIVQSLSKFSFINKRKTLKTMLKTFNYLAV